MKSGLSVKPVLKHVLLQAKVRGFFVIFLQKITIYLGMENGADSSIIEYGEYTDWIY